MHMQRECEIFMKEQEIIQCFFCFHMNKICMQAWRQGKKRKKKQNFHVFQKHLDVSVLIYCTLQELRGKVGDIFSHWGVLNGITVEYCFISTQESDVHYNWLRDAASA